jgi:phosphoglycolate phosphatase
VAKILLFDVDGTLVLTGGAGVQAMHRTFAELFGVENGLDGVEMAGRSDAAIFRSGLDKNGLPSDDFPGLVRRFRAVYRHHLAVTLREATGGRVLRGCGSCSRPSSRGPMFAWAWRRATSAKGRS